MTSILGVAVGVGVRVGSGVLSSAAGAAGVAVKVGKVTSVAVGGAAVLVFVGSTAVGVGAASEQAVKIRRMMNREIRCFGFIGISLS